MKTDAELKKDVSEELIWDPRVHEDAIGITVNEGIATLNGSVDSYAEKIAAEEAARRITGIKAVVMDIEVKTTTLYERTDEEIAKVAENNLKWHPRLSSDTINVKVEKGWITLEGTVNWNYQKEAAKKAVQNLFGVKGVSNLIEVKSAIEPEQVKEKIEGTFKRNAAIEADNIEIEVDGHTVTLVGKVRSWNEQKEIVDAAWSAPGIWHVVNKIEITDPEYA